MNHLTFSINGWIARLSLIGIYLGAMALLISSTGCGLAIQNGEKAVTEISASIADYSLPAGFGEAFGTRVAGYSLVGYTGDDGHSHIYLFQLPPGEEIDQAEVERQLQDATPGGRQDWQETQVVGNQPGTLMGQPVEMVISEGINHEGQAYRQVSGIFQGKGGQAMVIFERPVESWDQAEVDAFLASIH